MPGRVALECQGRRATARPAPEPGRRDLEAKGVRLVDSAPSASPVHTATHTHVARSRRVRGPRTTTVWARRNARTVPLCSDFLGVSSSPR